MQLDLLDSESDIKSFYSDDKRVRNIDTSHRQASDLRSVVAKDDHRMNGHYGLLGYSPADCHSSRNISGSEEGPLGIYEGRSQFLFVTRPRRSTRPNTAAVFPAFSDASRRERASRPLVQMLELKGAYATLS